MEIGFALFPPNFLLLVLGAVVLVRGHEMRVLLLLSFTSSHFIVYGNI